MKSRCLLKIGLAACLILPAMSIAQPKSSGSNKSLSQGIKENPIMAYVRPVFEDFRIRELNSDPKTGSVRISYQSRQKNRISTASAKKLPRNMEKARVPEALAKGIDMALPEHKTIPRHTRSYTTAKGVTVNCTGVILDDRKISNSICYAIFDHYYVQANMVWGLNGENKENAFSRSDDFVSAIIDRFSEYPEI